MNVYTFQFSFLHGKSTYLPYTAGVLVAAAKSDRELNAYYDFKEPLFIREDIDLVVEKIEDPCVCAFSNYIWNHEYNKVLARKIKEKYPGAKIIFGGHHITRDSSLMKSEPYIDFLSFGEGEISFRELLRAIMDERLSGKASDYAKIKNIAFREGNTILTTETGCPPEALDFPSPYLTGVFDRMFDHYPELNFFSVIETNRGCPYGCAYCDWGGGKDGSKMRLFPMEKIFAELRWLSDHGIYGFGFSDSNFGMFPRDEEITDEIIRLHNEFGVLNGFQTSYAKNSNDRVFSITKKLNDCGMNKGVTISFQSMNPETLQKINRKNISVESFAELMNRYAEAGIATYSELILGLPGETTQSLIDGIDMLLDSGQHNSIYIHNCERLPFSPMGDEEYRKLYGIETVKIPLNQPHRTMNPGEITEYSNLVVRTNTMSRADWVEMNVYSSVVQAFHHEGLLLFFALYLHRECGVKYSDFYKGARDVLLASETPAGEALRTVKSRFEAVARGETSPVFVDCRFGDVGWPAEEFLFISEVYCLEDFYSALHGFLSGYFDDGEFFEELLDFQKHALKKPFVNAVDFECSYNFAGYFSALLCGKAAKLKNEKHRCTVPDPPFYASWEEYSRHVVWYGRKDSRNVWVEEINTEHNNDELES